MIHSLVYNSRALHSLVSVPPNFTFLARTARLYLPGAQAHILLKDGFSGRKYNGRTCRASYSISQRPSSLVLVHLPVHASWLNQIEIYLSVVQRKVLIPNDFSDLDEVEARLLAFQDHYDRIAQPFE